MIILWAIGGFFFVCTVVLACLLMPLHRQPVSREYQTRAERIRHLQNRAAHHREQLDAIADEFTKLHHYDKSDPIANPLVCHIWFGDSYAVALDHVLESQENS